MISESLLQQIDICQKCKSIIGYSKFPSNSHGNLNSKYMLLSEAPGGDSISNSRYWTGAGGRLLRSVMAEFNKELEDIFFMTDIVKCWPNENGKNRKPVPEEIANCLPFLAQEIAQLKPLLVLAMGKVAAESVLGRSLSMSEAHGKTYEAHGTKVLAMYHPSQIDLFMNRGLYTNQIRTLLMRIIGGDTADFVLPTQGNDQITTNNNQQDDKMQDATSEIHSSFVLPAAGNSITAEDVKKGYLRITVDFKRYFPGSSTDVSVSIGGRQFHVRFEHRDGRSHLLKIGREGMQALNLSAGAMVKVEVVGSNAYRLSRLP